MNSIQIRKRKPRTRSAQPSIYSVRPQLSKSYAWPTDSHAWPTDFNHPRKFDCTIENESCQDFLHRHGADGLDSSGDEESDDDTSDEESGDLNDNGNTPIVPDLQVSPLERTQDPLRTFMNGLGGEDENSPCRDQTELVLSFCQPVKGQSGDEDGSKSRRVALVDDKSTTESQENLPLPGDASCDLLTRSDLHKRLSKPVRTPVSNLNRPRPSTLTLLTAIPP